ncbi:MAG: hypothetical protein K6E20_04915, partial [Acholeplasmatales bacterium]|nr:hypothetical protein [Acholeplasmatales bacterium]
IILIIVSLYFIIHGTIKIMYFLEKYDNYINNKTTVKKPDNKVVKIYLIMMIVFQVLSVLTGWFIYKIKTFSKNVVIIDNTNSKEKKLVDNKDFLIDEFEDNKSCFDKEPIEDEKEPEKVKNNTIEEVEEVKKRD